MAYFGKNQRDIWWNNTRGKFRGSREDMKNIWVLALSRPTYEVSKLCLCVTNMSLSTTPNQVASINSILFLSFFINYFDHHGKKIRHIKIVRMDAKFSDCSWWQKTNNEIWNFRLRYQSIWTDCTTNKQKTENRLALPPTWKNFGINPFSLSSCSTPFSFWSCSYFSWTKINFTYSGR